MAMMKMKLEMNAATMRQMQVLILADCVEQVNKQGHTSQQSYDQALRAMFKNRTQDQKELAV